MQKTITSLTDVPAIATYFARIGAEPRSLRLGVVREPRGGGYWLDTARIYIDIVTGAVRVFNDDNPETQPTKEEQKAIIEQIVDYRFPA